MTTATGWRCRVERCLRALRWVAAASVLPLTAQGQSTVPSHWIRYADQVSAEVQRRLSDPSDEAVQRLHGWLQERRLASDEPLPQELVLRLWIDANGRIERLLATPLGRAEADAGLQKLLAGWPLPLKPPPDMARPLLLQLDLHVLDLPR